MHSYLLLGNGNSFQIRIKQDNKKNHILPIMEMKGNENDFTYKHLQDVEHPQCDNSEHCGY